MEPTPLEPGTQIGHYIIERLVAVGGSAVVYQARDPRARRDVAIKLLRNGATEDEDRGHRLLHEARSYTRLVHSRIVTLYEVDEVDGCPFLVMEWVDGTTLAERLESGPLSPEENLRIMSQVADGLSAAHALGLAHRDIKPANIMLTPDGDAKLLDFGLAKQVGPVASLPRSLVTVDGALLGTPAYMSPEQAYGKPLSLASDVFAFGTVLFEGLAGRPAFERATTLETLNAVTGGKPDPLPRQHGRLAKELSRLAHWCLARKPEDRPKDARELVVELGRLNEPGSMIPLKVRKQWLSTAVASLLAVLATLSVCTLFRSTTNLPPPDLGARILAADGNLPVITSDGSAVVFCSTDDREIWRSPLGNGNPELIWKGRDPIIGLSLSPDDRQVLFVSAENNGSPWIWEVPVNGGIPRKITKGFSPAVSPDGRLIAALLDLSGRDRQLIVCRIDGTERRVIASFDSSTRPLSCAFPTSGDSVVVVLTDGVHRSRLARINLTDGEIEQITETLGIASQGLALSPRLNAALWCLKTSPSTPQMLTATDLDNGQTRSVLPGPGIASHPSLTADGSKLVLDVRERVREIIEVNVDPESDAPSSTIRVLNGTRGGSQPRVSPDAKKLVFRSLRGDLWVLERSTGNMGPLLTTGVASFNPSWSPDGRQIAFACIKANHSALWVAGADGSDPRQITWGEWNAFQPEWHPDGKHLLFISDRDGQEDLYCLDLETGEMVRLGFEGAANPAIGPEGRTIAYAIPSRSRGGRLRLVTLTDDFQSIEILWERPIIVNRWAGGKPRFSPDGRWVAFDQPSGTVGADIWVLPADDSGAVQPRRLTDFEFPTNLGSWFDWSPDNKLLVTLTRDPDQLLLLEDAELWINQALR